MNGFDRRDLTIFVQAVEHAQATLAHVLDLSETTVVAYSESARTKLDARTTTQAVVMAMRHRLGRSTFGSARSGGFEHRVDIARVAPAEQTRISARPRSLM